MHNSYDCSFATVIPGSISFHVSLCDADACFIQMTLEIDSYRNIGINGYAPFQSVYQNCTRENASGGNVRAKERPSLVFDISAYRPLGRIPNFVQFSVHRVDAPGVWSAVMRIAFRCQQHCILPPPITSCVRTRLKIKCSKCGIHSRQAYHVSTRNCGTSSTFHYALCPVERTDHSLVVLVYSLGILRM